MSYARQMLDTYPRTLHPDDNLLAAAIDAISDCAQACTADVDADLSDFIYFLDPSSLCAIA